MKSEFHKPPQIAEWLLYNSLGRYDRDFVIGDFAEFYEEIRCESGTLTAVFWYWLQIIKSIPHFINNFFFGRITMLKNYFLVAFRNFKKYKGYSFINVAGLAMAMACCILIFIYIINELSYDRYNEKADRIYRLIAILTLGGKPNPIASTNFPPAIALRNDFPEVINSARFRLQQKTPVKFGEKQFFEEYVSYADETVFDIFTLPMLNGDPKTALKTAYSVVITKDMANKYFGVNNPIGKILKFNNKYDYTVTGVIKNVPRNSHFKFDMLCSMESLRAQNRQLVESWSGPFGSYSYVLLKEGCDYKELEKKFPAFVDKYMGDDLKESAGVDIEYFLQPLTTIHLHSHRRHEMAGNSNITYIYIFAIVALFILLMACINFMNLATARSAKRAREIGMRKVLGGDRANLIKQFFGESLIYSFLSLFLALILAKFTLPFFNSIAERELSLNFAQIPWLLPAFIGLALLVGLIAGSYPAIFLSGFRTIKVLKGNTVFSASNSRFRKILVIAQFTISIILLIGTAIISNQLSYMKNKKLGFKKERVVVLPIMDKSIITSLKSIKADLNQYHGVISVAASSHVPGKRPSGGNYIPEGFAEGNSVMMNGMNIDTDYIVSER